MSSERLETLRRRLAAREGKPGSEENCQALRAEIARLEGGEALAQFLKSEAPPEDMT